MVPGVVVKFGRQCLQFAFVDFAVTAESSVMVMYQLNVELMSTNLIMHLPMPLIHVHP